MGCGKTAKLINDIKSFSSNDKKAIVIKPKLDTKNGNKLLSRDGRFYTVDYLISRNGNLLDLIDLKPEVRGIFIDEAQFFTKKQVNQMLKIATIYDIPVNAYGLRLNFYLEDKNFAGATRLLQVAHKLVCIESKCDFCKSEQAIFSCLFINGKLQTSGPSILISDGTRVVDAHALCAKCYYKFLAKSS
jgi:thymidine kinase